MGEVFASAPFIVGKSEPSPTEAHIPAEEALCPVVSHDWVNDEYKHLVVAASPKALAVNPGQFFNLLCPSPDAGELWLRRPQSVYRIDAARGRVEFLYKCVGRGTKGLATLKKEALLSTKGLDRNIARTQRLVEKSVDIVHQFARELRPAVLDDLGLIPALHSFVKLFSNRTRIHVHLRAFAGVEQLNSDQRTILYRVAQEALACRASHLVL